MQNTAPTTPRATPRAVWHLRANGVVVAWAVAAAVVAVTHRWVPAAPWVTTHLLLLGAASTAILVWSAHFAQAVSRRPLPGGEAHQLVRLSLHTVGAIAVVVAVPARAGALLAGGAAAVAVAAVWHGVALVRLGRARVGLLGGGLAWTTWAFVASAACLPVGVGLGVVLSRADTAGDVAARAYVAHVAVLLLGWVGLAALGSLVALWPTMVRVPARGGPGTRRAIGGLVAAVAVAPLGAAAGLRWVTAAGLAAFAAGVVNAVRNIATDRAARRPRAFADWSVVAALTWLVATATTWSVLVASASGWTTAQVRSAALVPALAVGFGGQVLVGALAHLGPMVLGGGPAAVRATRAVTEWGGAARLVLLNGGLLLAVLPAPRLVAAVGSAVALGALLVAPATLVVGAVRARRGRSRGVVAPPAAVVGARRAPQEPAPPLSPAAAWVAAAALVLVATAGVAANPAAAGLRPTGTSTGGDVAPTGRVVEVEVEARDMRFVPDVVTVAAGDELVLVVTNTDDVAHDLVLATGATTGRLAPGDAARVAVGVVRGDLDGWCSVAGHRQMGMTLGVHVTGPAGHTAMPGAMPTGAMPTGTPASAPPDLSADPGPGFEPYDAVLAPASSATVHQVTLAVTEVEQEVAPGLRQTRWTFGGTAPGPVLRGHVGDTFVVTLVNDGTIGHSVDFHAGALAPDRPMRTIEPGESLTYTFTATRSGIWMYHCATMPMSLHIANGMVGAVIIDPPDLPPVDREYLLVQSELYPGPDGGPADEDAVAGDAPSLMAFNGYAAQYDHAPLTADVGERVRIWVLDAGPNRPSSFHVVGGQLDTVFLEGAWQLGGPHADPAGTGGAQALALQPAQGGFVELTFPEVGTYPFVSHVMVDAERGAHGLVVVR